MSDYVRVRPPACALRHPEHGEMVVPNPAQAYRTDDPLVLAFPWQFGTDDEIEAEKDAAAAVESVTIPRKRAPRGRK